MKILGILRIPFLILTPACLMVGLGAALYSGASWSAGLFSLVLFGALCAHAAVNTFNEIGDFHSGLDFLTAKTPFSGGSGTLPQYPQLAPAAKLIAWTILGLTVLTGLVLLLLTGPALLPVGLAGLLIILAYTPICTKLPWAGLVAPGLGFGPLMVLGCQVVLAGHYSWTAFLSSLVPFFLVNNLLLLNQFPDAGADHRVGRKNFSLLFGARAGARLYTVQLTAAYLVIPLGNLAGVFPLPTLLSLLTLPAGMLLVTGVLNYREHSDVRNSHLALNTIVTILTPVLFGIGFMLG